MGSVVTRVESTHVIPTTACRATKHMDDLSQQISSGLPKDWVPVPQPFPLPQHTLNAYSASNGARRLMFLRVKGPLNSAMPLFMVNSELRDSGFETVWLFDDEPIPSTKHMPCASIRMFGHKVVATLKNVGQDPSLEPQMMDLASLAKAAAEKRMRVTDFEAGSSVNVTITSEEKVCVTCGAISSEVQLATFFPADEPGAPGLTLSKSKLGRNVSFLIADALKLHFPTSSCELGDCVNAQNPGFSSVQKVTRTICALELSNLAAFELLRHSTTAWYVS